MTGSPAGMLAGALAGFLPLVPTIPAAQTGPLPSWNDGPAKRAILEFVARVTTPRGPDFVPPAERIATFDNDGTLWSEQPMYFQFAFALDRIRAMAPAHPEWRDQQPYAAVLTGDVAALASGGEKALLPLLATTHAGMTTEEFQSLSKEWLATARHPRFGRRYAELVYQPMLELLAFLRENEFRIFIVSGGGVEFIRAFAEGTYGVPPERVVGSSVVATFHAAPDGSVSLVKEPKVEFVDDGPGKPVGINRFIGRRPILAFGNSDGDLQMLQYTAAGSGARLMALLHHTDGEREYAYDRRSRVGRLDKALDEATRRGWVVVDMAREWRTVHPAGQGGSPGER